MDALNANPPARAGFLPRNALPYWIRDFALVRPAVITFAVVALVSVAGAVTSHVQLQGARLDEQRAAAQRDAERRRFLYAESEKQEIRAYQPLFMELRRRHFVGTESRLDWVDAIGQIQERHKLLPVTYEIDAQQPYRLEGRVVTGDYRLLGSRMTLRMDMVHEMDLFNFLVDLRQHGVFTVRQCTLKRTAGTGTGAAPQAVTPVANLSSDCTLDWLTLTPAPRRPGGAR